MDISTIGLDLAKNIFQVHGINAQGEPVVRKALRRSQMLPFFDPKTIALFRAYEAAVYQAL